MISLFRRLWSHIDVSRQRQFGALLALTIVTSVAEVASLGAVMPFIGAITQPDRVLSSSVLAPAIRALGILDASQLIIPLAIAFGGAAVIAGGLRLLLLWVNVRLGNEIGADLGVRLYYRTLHQPYAVHISRNSSEIISGITQKISVAAAVLTSAVTVITSATLFIAILATLLLIDWAIATTAATCFGAGYAAIAWKSRARLAKNSQHIAHEQTNVVKTLQTGLGGIRDVLLDATQSVHCASYRAAVEKLQRAATENSFLSQAPRYAMEALGVILIALLTVMLGYRDGGVGAALPILGVLAMGAQRLLPLMQQLYGNWSLIAGSKQSLVDVLQLLEQPIIEAAARKRWPAIKLQQGIQFDRVSFRYSITGPWVIRDLDLTIASGARVGIVGTTGSGKSTALDLLMGLLEPTAGAIYIDGQPLRGEMVQAWRASIAHVPQTVYLADASIAENIAFGLPLPLIDLERVRRAASQAKIDSFIESSPQGYATKVGERGVRLSGGQRQRLGIARALYKCATVLVFDEATSALDSETEKAVMDAINDLSPDLTVFMIAHRLTTLRRCSEILHIDGGRLVSRSSYADFIEKHPVSA